MIEKLSHLKPAPEKGEENGILAKLRRTLNSLFSGRNEVGRGNGTTSADSVKTKSDTPDTPEVKKGDFGLPAEAILLLRVVKDRELAFSRAMSTILQGEAEAKAAGEEACRQLKSEYTEGKKFTPGGLIQMALQLELRPGFIEQLENRRRTNKVLF